MWIGRVGDLSHVRLVAPGSLSACSISLRAGVLVIGSIVRQHAYSPTVRELSYDVASLSTGLYDSWRTVRV